MPPSVPRPTNYQSLTRYCLIYFYMKTWICPNSTVFNTTSNLCVSCSIVNCLSCFNLTSCAVCNTGYAVDTATGLCQTCNLIGCTNCSTTTTCLACSANYVLTNQTCLFCNASNNYFPNYVN